MAVRSVSHRSFQVTRWTLKSWMVIYLYMSWTDCYSASVTAQQDVIYIPPQGFLRLLPDTSSVTEPITGILWKHGPNKAAEWDLVLGPVVDYFGTFKTRTELDKETGQLVINNMTITDGGEYTVHINGRLLDKTYTVKLIKKVPKPVVIRLPCDSDSTSCEVQCILPGDVTDYGPVTYRWKKDEGEWMVSPSGPNSHRLIVTKDEAGKVKTLTCEVNNMFSCEWSDPEPNQLYHEGSLSTGGIVGIIVAVIVAVGLVLGLGVIYRDRIRERRPCLQPAREVDDGGEPKPKATVTTPLNPPDESPAS